jgi:hypothetical protein
VCLFRECRSFEKAQRIAPPAKLIHGESGDEDADRCLAFNIGAGESIESPPFAQNAKDGPPARQFAHLVIQYEKHPEAKSLAPDGNVCNPETQGPLRRAHIIAEEIR